MQVKSHGLAGLYTGILANLLLCLNPAIKHAGMVTVSCADCFQEWYPLQQCYALEEWYPLHYCSCNAMQFRCGWYEYGWHVTMDIMSIQMTCHLTMHIMWICMYRWLSIMYVSGTFFLTETIETIYVRWLRRSMSVRLSTYTSKTICVSGTMHVYIQYAPADYRCIDSIRMQTGINVHAFQTIQYIEWWCGVG